MAGDSTPVCDIIIVTRNRLADTVKCLESVEKNTAGAISYRYIFVDNNSTDGTLEHLRKFGGSVLVENGKDLGFVRAVNQGLEKVRAKYAVRLSCDAFVTPGWLDTLVGHLEADPNIGAVGPMGNTAGVMQYDDPQDAGTEPGEISEYGKNFHLKNGGLTAEYHLIGGFCMVMRSKLIPKIGLLDTRFDFGPLCDEDYCRRMRGAGYGILIAGDVFVYGATAGEVSPPPEDPDLNPPFLEQKDRDYFLRKWVRPGNTPTRTTKKPLVSVIMATRDREATIPAAIGSVLSQTYRNFELVIVNDGGTDIRSTINGFGDRRIRYFRLEKHGGKSHANNYAIDRAKGDVIAYLDDDDRWHRDHLQVTVGELVKFESRMFVYADYIKVDCLVDRNGTQLPVKKELMRLENARYDSLDPSNFIPNFAIVHKKSLFEAERYDEALDFLEDWDLIRRFSKHAYFVRVPEATGEYWINMSGPTRNSSTLFDKNMDTVIRYVTTKYSLTKNRVLLDLYSADKLAKSSEWRRALGIYKGILGTDPEYIPALEGYANCLYNLQQYGQCSKVLDQLVKRDLNNHGMYMLYSRALIKTGDYEKAKTWLELALVVNPDAGALDLLQDCYAGMHKKNSSEFIKSQIRKKQTKDNLASEQPPTNDELNRRISYLETEKTGLTGQVSDLETEKTNLAGRISDLETEKTRLTGQVSDLETEKTRLTGQVSDLETEKTNLTGRVSDLQADKADLQADKADLQADKAVLTGNVSGLETEKTRLTGHISDLEDERTDLTGRMSDLETEKTRLTAMVSDLEGEKTDLTGRVSDLETEKTGLTERISDLQADKADLQADKADLTGNVSDLETEKTRLAGRVSDLERERADLAGRVSDLETEKTRLTAMVSDLTAKNARITLLNEQIDGLRSTIEHQQKTVVDLESSFALRMCRKYDRTVGRVIPLKPGNKTNTDAKQPVPERRNSQTEQTSGATRPSKKDIVCFPIIDWGFRYQRSQHLMSKFAEADHRVFYLTVDLDTLDTPYKITEIKKNVYELRISSSAPFNIYRDKFDAKTLDSIFESFSRTKDALDIDGISFVQFPTWFPLVHRLKKDLGMRIVFDCLDNFTEFDNVSSSRTREERDLIRSSDMITATSSFLLKKMRSTKAIMVPNAGEYDHFSKKGAGLLSYHKKPVIGYFGAISSWFDSKLIEHAATRRPDWTFVLIGGTTGSDMTGLKKLPNVHILGERPYSDLPGYLSDFDVCLIPFVDTPLIEATHPVKIYEYFSAGKPVVATSMIELVPMSHLCYLSRNRKEFLSNIELALKEDDKSLVERRKEFAGRNTWQDRFETIRGKMAESGVFHLNTHS